MFRDRALQNSISIISIIYQELISGANSLPFMNEECHSGLLEESGVYAIDFGVSSNARPYGNVLCHFVNKISLPM